jgi:chromosome segregation ATPase
VLPRPLVSLAMDSEEIDLSNVDYEDVLNLYRGWRRSEGALKEKSKELNSLKDRMKHLQDSHVKFRSQIQALESVKELTISLQTQLSILQQENYQLNVENRKLSEQKREVDEVIAVKSKAEAEASKILKELQQEMGTLRIKCSDMTYAHRNLENSMAQEAAMRSAAEARAQSQGDTADSLRREVKDLKAKLDTSAARMVQCDMELQHASDQLRNLSLEVSNMAETNSRSKSAEAEVTVMKADIARLLRLLEHYPAARKFLRHWQDSQGMSFVGMGSSVDDEIEGMMNITGRSKPEEESEDEEQMAASWDELGISPNELAHMKRVYSGGDTFPMTESIDVIFQCRNDIPYDDVFHAG